MTSSFSATIILSLLLNQNESAVTSSSNSRTWKKRKKKCVKRSRNNILNQIPTKQKLNSLFFNCVKKKSSSPPRNRTHLTSCRVSFLCLYKVPPNEESSCCRDDGGLLFSLALIEHRRGEGHRGRAQPHPRKMGRRERETERITTLTLRNGFLFGGWMNEWIN